MPRPLTIPGGKEKGLPIEQASTETLEYWCGRIGQDLATGKTNPKFVEQDTRLHQAMQSILQARARTQQSTGTAIVVPKRDEVQGLCGHYDDPGQAMEKLREAAETCHLITPQTAVGVLPVGTSVLTQALWLDPDRDAYTAPGIKGYALKKHALDRIAAMAAIDWDTRESRRLDDGKDAHYCAFVAVGTVRNFDGSKRHLPGTVEIDLRDGSAQIDEYYNDETPAPPHVPKGLQVARKFILRLAESKAQNRAVRKLLRAAYTREELAKPFVVASVVWTGQTDDPELKRFFAQKNYEAFHGAQRALWGDEPAQSALPPATHSAPPVGESYYDDDDEYPPELGPGGGRVVDMQQDERQGELEYSDRY